MRLVRPGRRSLASIAGAVLLLPLAVACGGGGSSNTGGSNAGSGSSSNSKPQTQQQLAAAAKKEGTVVWYTTFADKDVQPMIAAFNKKYPGIKVQPLRLSADKLPPRVITEQRGGKYNADVISGDAVQVSQLLNSHALAPYDAPDEAPLPSDLKLPDGYRGVIYVVTTVIAYNPSALKSHHIAPPTSWADLTKPQWKGNFSIDPGAVNFYESLIASMGHTKALKLIQGLGNNSPRLVESHTLALTQVQSGEPMATATAYGYKAASLEKKTPGQIKFVNSNPLPSSLTLIDMAKNAPHPNAAKLFIDWMESQAGQQAVVSITNHTSLRDDVGNDTSVWDTSKWPPAWADPTVSPDQYNKYLSEYKQALHAS